MKKIQYVKGDLFEGVKNSTNSVVILHICNDVGGWGKGFVLELSKRWSDPEKVYRDAFKNKKNCSLGDITGCLAAEGVTVINMVAQHGYYHEWNNPTPLDYTALEKCLSTVATDMCAIEFFSDEEVEREIHMPKIGAGLAKGDWSRIEWLIERTLGTIGVPVYVYEL